MKQKVLITGGAGFIGARLAEIVRTRSRGPCLRCYAIRKSI